MVFKEENKMTLKELNKKLDFDNFFPVTFYEIDNKTGEHRNLHILKIDYEKYNVVNTLTSIARSDYSSLIIRVEEKEKAK